ncbi:hypothetical protein B0O99DRAFT_597520 [Bisporella sp. PMI_857]|nr:hypothetical protein B0O99DRAFT_597520 [Bisporella sp. PMI_857]
MRQEGEQCARWGEPCDPHQDLYFAWDRSQRQNRPNIDPGLPAEDLLRAYKEAETARLELNLAEAKIHRPDPAVADRHQDVIDGMTRIYDTLIAMGYLAESNSRRSPHDEVPVAFQQLRSVGFDKDVIELLLHMPYISESHGNLLDSYELAPDTLSMSYLSNSMNDLGAIRDPLETGYNDIAPWDGKITAWKGSRSTFYLDLPKRLAKLVLDGWHQKLVSLTWLPDYARDGYLMPRTVECLDYAGARREHPTYFTDPKYTRQARTFRDEVNKFHAIKKIYYDHGWPDAFRGDEFKRTRLEWERRRRALTNWNRERSEADELVESEFLKQAASDDAV